MSRLLITVGLDSRKSDAPPHLVYLGRSGADQKAAEAASHLPRLLRINHGVGIPKNNPRAADNATALDAAGASEDSVIEVTAKDMEAYQAEMKRLQDLATERGNALVTSEARIAELEAKLAAVAAPTPALVPPNSPEQGESSQTPSTESAAPAPEAPPSTGESGRRGRRS